MDDTTSVIPDRDSIDPDVLKTMASLQCFKDKEKLQDELISAYHNTEKVVYFLLLDRKLRNPSTEDEYEVKTRSNSADPPRKRVDSRRFHREPRLSLGNISEGSPTMPRRALTVAQIRKNSLSSSLSSPASSPYQSPLSTPRGTPISTPRSTPKTTPRATPSPSPNPTPPGSPNAQAAWRSRLHTIKNNFLGSPRFHRRKVQVSDEISMTPDGSPELSKKSWFGSLMGGDREDQLLSVTIREKPFNQIKAELVHAFLATSDIIHTVVSPTSFRAEYRRSGGSSVFSRNIKFQVDIIASKDEANVFIVTFILLAGPARRFKRLCEILQSVLLSTRSVRTSSDLLGSDGVSSCSSSSFSSERDRISPTISAGNGEDEVFLRAPPTPKREARTIANGSRKALLEPPSFQDKV